MTDPQLQRVAGGAAPVLNRLTRFGFAAKGLVTVLVGVLALRYALGRGGKPTGQQGAIESVLRQPFGRLALAVLGAGLAAYALWQFVAAFIDPERKGAGLRGVAERVGSFVTGVGYALLASASGKLLLGRYEAGETDLDDIAATLLTPYAGRALVGLAGVAVVIAGLLQLRLGVTGRFRDSLQEEMSGLERIVLTVSGGLGYVTLGVLSLMVGSSLVQVALKYDPSEAGGWDRALWLLSRFGQGRWLLGGAAVGLISYGLYFMLLVRYRRL